MDTFQLLRTYIREMAANGNLKKKDCSKSEASTTANVSGYTLPLGASNRSKDITDEEMWKAYAKAYANAKKI